MADTELEFLAPTGFEWDDQKRELNLAKHDIDFESAIEVFYGSILLPDRIATMRSAGPLWVIREID
jgi:hypothetical protein